MKKYKGYLVAAGGLLFTFAITYLAKRYGDLLDAFYPYVSRSIQQFLAACTSLLPFTLWQAIVVILVVAGLATLIYVFARKRSFIRWLGWVLATASLLWTAHTTVQGLNFYASSLAEDLHMELTAINKENVEEATLFFLEKANDLAGKLPRDDEGNLIFDDFETLAEQAAEGYQVLSREQGYAVFSGSTLPVKKLAWSGMYSAMGICGVTMGVTGEAAVNPDIPNMYLPFVMCHEMAHRMAIAPEDDANFAAFLACDANSDLQFQYSAYYMAFRYCLHALPYSTQDEILTNVDPLLMQDLRAYDTYFAEHQIDFAALLADKVNNGYIQASGDPSGVASYNNVVIQLTNWYLSETEQPEQDSRFDPLDKTYIDGILGERDA